MIFVVPQLHFVCARNACWDVMMIYSDLLAHWLIFQKSNMVIALLVVKIPITGSKKCPLLSNHFKAKEKGTN